MDLWEEALARFGLTATNALTPPALAALIAVCVPATLTATNLRECGTDMCQCEERQCEERTKHSLACFLKLL